LPRGEAATAGEGGPGAVAAGEEGVRGALRRPPQKAPTEGPDQLPHVPISLLASIALSPFLGGNIIKKLLVPTVIKLLRTIAKRCKAFTPLLAAPAALLLSQGEAKAILNFNIFESGGSVIVRTSGSVALPNSFGAGVNPDAGVWGPTIGQISTGNASPVSNSLLFFKVLGPTSIPGSTNFSPASSVSGNNTSLGVGPLFQFFLGSQLLALNSPAGGERFSEAVFNGKSLTDFGITTSGLLGTWTLQPADGSDPYTANDTINLIAGPSSAAVPGPLPLLGAGAAFGWSRRLRKRIATPLSTPPQA